VLKHILRSMLRMMQSSGTAEGMRTLIDSSLLKSVDTIIEYRGVFGPTILPIGKSPTVCGSFSNSPEPQYSDKHRCHFRS
jgi:hypothetical protein